MLVAYQLCVIAVLLFIKITQNEAKDSVKTVYFLSSSATFNPSYMSHYSMNVSHDKKVADIFVGVAQTYTLDPFMSLSITLMTSGKTSGKPMFLYNFNGCEMFGKVGRRSNGFLTPWLKKFWSQSTLPQSCPVQKGNYSWIGMSMDQLYIPPFMPASKYSIIAYTYFAKSNQKDSIGNLTLKIEIK